MSILSPATSDPEALAASIAATVADYRAADGVSLTPEGVLAWGRQFDAGDRAAVLRETDAILRSRYLSEADVREWLEGIIGKIAGRAGAASPQAFLRETAFLDLQEPGKSQPAMLAMLDEILRARYGMSVAECGGGAPVRYVYLDDVLCTANTVYYDLQGWLTATLEDGRRRIDALAPATPILLVYAVAHRLNWHKLESRLRRLDPRAVRNLVLWHGILVENDAGRAGAALDFAFPRRAGQPPEVEQYAAGLGVPVEQVFRPDALPREERLFTSPAGRDQFERAVLAKGLEMLAAAATRKENIRPLGFTLPSHKTLGFGALCFTWRNVPNNSPLVFWYDSPIFKPLFPKRPAPVLEFDVIAFG